MMSLRTLFEWVDTFPTSIALRESLYGYAWLLTAHVVGMAVFAGLVIMMDLRLVGWANNRTPLTQIQHKLFPWQVFGMTVSAVTGFLLVYSQPLRYFPKVFFWIKMGMMALAGLNALVFHMTTYKSVAEWDDDSTKLPFTARLAGGLSLFLWAGAIVFGRFTAYNWLD